MAVGVDGRFGDRVVWRNSVTAWADDLRETKVDMAVELESKGRIVWEIVNHTGHGKNLSGADLSEADLSETDLRGATLSGADLGETFLTQAVYDLATMWPDSVSLQEVGAIRLSE